MYVVYAGDTFFISYGHVTIRWHTLVNVVIRRTCPKILCMHKISNVCRRIDYIHTVQPDSFSTVGAFSTVATVLDESLYNVSIDMI